MPGCDLCRFRAAWCSGTTQHRGQATRNTGGRSEYSMSFLAPLNHKDRIRSPHHKIQSCCCCWEGGGRAAPAISAPSPLAAGERAPTFLSARKDLSHCCFLCARGCQLAGIPLVVSQRGSGRRRGAGSARPPLGAGARGAAGPGGGPSTGAVRLGAPCGSRGADAPQPSTSGLLLPPGAGGRAGHGLSPFPGARPSPPAPVPSGLARGRSAEATRLRGARGQQHGSWHLRSASTAVGPGQPPLASTQVLPRTSYSRGSPSPASLARAPASHILCLLPGSCPSQNGPQQHMATQALSFSSRLKEQAGPGGL